MAQGVDYSFSRPNPGQLRAAGYTFACRYLTGSGKAIDRDELGALLGAGLAVVVVYEAGPDNALGGAAQGHLDGLRANLAADELGWPADRPLYYAVDFDDRGHPGSLERVREYIAAARSVGREARVYGSIRVVDAVALPGWQTAAWSGGAVSAHAVIWQHIFQVDFHGSSIDVNDARAADIGQHPYAPPTPPPPPHAPVTTDFGAAPVKITDLSMNLDGAGNGHVPVKDVKASQVVAVTGIATPSPEKVGHYTSVPTVNLTIGADGWAEIVVERGPAGGPVTVRVAHI